MHERRSGRAFWVRVLGGLGALASTGGCNQPFGFELSDAPFTVQSAYSNDWDRRDDTPALALRVEGGERIYFADGHSVFVVDDAEHGVRRGLREIDGELWLSYEDWLGHYKDGNWTYLPQPGLRGSVDGSSAREVWFAVDGYPSNLFCRILDGQSSCYACAGAEEPTVTAGRLWWRQWRENYPSEDVATISIADLVAGPVEPTVIELDLPHVAGLGRVEDDAESVLVLFADARGDHRPRVVSLNGEVQVLDVPLALSESSISGLAEAISLGAGVFDVLTSELGTARDQWICFVSCTSHIAYHHVRYLRLSPDGQEELGFLSNLEYERPHLWRFGAETRVSLGSQWLRVDGAR